MQAFQMQAFQMQAFQLVELAPLGENMNPLFFSDQRFPDNDSPESVCT